MQVQKILASREFNFFNDRLSAHIMFQLKIELMQAAGLKLLANRANGDFSRLKYSINKTTNHFAPLQPSAAGAFFQDFALLFGIVTALQRSLLGHDRSYGGRRVRPAATGRHRSSSSIRCRRLRCCDRRRSPSCTHCSCDRYSSSTGTTNTVRRHSRQTGAIDTRRRYRPFIARLLFSIFSNSVAVNAVCP